MKPKKTPTISFKALVQMLQESGFEIVVTSEKKLIKGVVGPKVRARATSTVIKGLIVPDENVIMINRSLDTKERVVTALHELIHLHSPQLSESATERQALRMYKTLSDKELGFVEFLVS